VAASLKDLAGLHCHQGRYADAEPLYKRALTTNERTYGPGHLIVATSLGGVADLYRIRGRYADAEPLDKRSLAIREKTLGPDHPAAPSLHREAFGYKPRNASALDRLSRDN
jgi:hypothetical protein